MKTVGGEVLRDNLIRFPREFIRATMRGQYAAAQVIMLDARRRAPFEEGDLEHSGYATRPERTSDGASVEMGFGNARTERYVVRQHEDLDLHHPGERAIALGVTKVGEAKFFSNAIAVTKTVANKIIADAVRFFIIHKKLPSWAAKLVPETPDEQ